MKHNIPILTNSQIKQLDSINKNYPLSEFLSNNRMIEEMGIDFIHSSAKVEGNTYDRFDSLTLLKYGVTAGGKKFSDAQAILNIRDAYNDMLKVEEGVSIGLIKDFQHTLSKNLLTSNQQGVTFSGDEKLQQILDAYESIECQYSAAIYLHLNICYLQYFEDCNKRTARQLQNTSLILDGKLPLLFSEASVANYTKTVIKYYETGDSSEYVEWFVKTYKDTWI